MLAVQCIIILVSPFAALGYARLPEALQLLLVLFTFLVCLLSRGVVATALAITALLCFLTGSLLQILTPAEGYRMLAYGGSIGAFIIATYALGHAALLRAWSRCTGCSAQLRSISILV
jgi:hypothetical protein